MVGLRRGEAVTLDMFLFPYGGGSASSYRSYAGKFPISAGRVVPVELPGRGKRSEEPFAKSIEQCAALTLAQIDTSEDYVLHGHCMGALIAFEAIKLLKAEGARLPRFMVTSGRNAPRHVNDWLRRLPGMDDRALFAELQARGGVPRGLSFAMARHFLTVLRADEAMFRNYDPGNTRIEVPILALAGKSDDMTSAAALADWQDYTSNLLAIEWLDGEHYFIFEQAERVGQIVQAFGEMLAAPDDAGLCLARSVA